MRLLLLGLLVATTAHAQTGTITGTIRDAATGETLPGANVRIDGMHLGAAADIKGRFVIRDVPVGTYVVRTSFSGYQLRTATLVVDGDVHFDAELRTATPPPLTDPADDWGYIPIVDFFPMTSRRVSGAQIRRLPVGH